MNKFLHKIFKVIILPFLVVSLGFIGFVIIVNNIASSPNINQQKIDIYIGDSHIRYAINDSIIIRGKNVALNSESYYFSYYKLKKILEKNDVKNIFLGYSYHNISSYYDRFIFGDYSKSVSPPYFYILPVKEQFHLIILNGNDFHYIKTLIKMGFKMLLNGNKPYMGSFANSFIDTYAVNSSMDKRIEFQYYNDKELYEFSNINLEYLNRIILLCKENEVKLHLINTPVFKYYHAKVPELYKSKLDNLLNDNEVEYIDLSNELTNKKFFIPDGDHLSSEGANFISKKINKAQKHNNDSYSIGLPQAQ